MNEVKRCSLSGVAFTMDTDAYEALNEYLNTLRHSYRTSADCEEIVADIEARIAELILTTQDSSHVVEKPLILNIIRQMGSAEDIAEEAFEGAESGDEPRIPRRLYRDMENAKLGGVCAGIGKYFDIDPVWIRLAMFLPVLTMVLFQNSWAERIMGNLFGVFLICYVVMWFAVPVARSARQRLEMNGERITAQAIGEQTSTAASTDADATARPIVAQTVSVFGQVVLILLKIFAGAMVFGLILAACGLTIAIISLTIGGNELPIEPFTTVWLPIMICVVVLLPILLIIYVLMCLIASRKPGARTVLAVFILWICSVAGCAGLALREDVVDKLLPSAPSIYWGDGSSEYESGSDISSLREMLEETE